jgi:hypothetical protein
VSPTVLREGPYRFFFFSSDRGEPRHVHVGRDDKAAKFWLEPVRMAYNQGFASSELQRVKGLVQRHQAALVKEWNAYFRASR